MAETVTASKAVDGDRVRVSGAAVLRCPALGYDDTRAIARDETLCASVIDGYSRYSLEREDARDARADRRRVHPAIARRGRRSARASITSSFSAASARKTVTIIPEGAIVTVSGLARWTTDEERSGLRSIGRTLELTGTEKEPIVIEAVPLEKWIDQQKITENAITTGVRIGANNSSADRAESESSTAEVRFDEAPNRSTEASMNRSSMKLALAANSMALSRRAERARARSGRRPANGTFGNLIFNRGHITLSQQIQFATNSDEIQEGQSEAVLRDLAALLRDNQQIRLDPRRRPHGSSRRRRGQLGPLDASRSLGRDVPAVARRLQRDVRARGLRRHAAALPRRS